MTTNDRDEGEERMTTNDNRTESEHALRELKADVRHERLTAARVPISRALHFAIARETYERTPAVIDTLAWGIANVRSAPDDEDAPPPVLVLLGGIGTGKTTAAAVAIANVEHARYTKSWKLAAVWANRFRNLDPWHELVDAPLLVLDELGAESDSEISITNRALAELLDERDGQGITIICSNLPTRPFLARLDERTRDRMRASMLIVELAGESMRKGAPLG